MKNYFFICLLLGPVLVAAQVYPDVQKRGTPVTSIDQIAGDWTCVLANNMVGMEDPPSDVHLNNFRYINDSIWHMEYPCSFYYLSIASKNLGGRYPLFNQIRFLHDTLVVSGDNNMEFCGDYFYVRDTFDQKIIDILLRDTFYLPAMFGKWYLQTKAHDPYSGEPPWKISYPFYLPPVIKFDLADVVNKNTILLNINGKLRKFKVTRCSLFEGYIEIEPYGWYKEPFRITYFDRVDRYY